MRFYKFYEKFTITYFLFVCLFLLKILLQDIRPEGAQNWSKIRFFRYYQKSMHGTVLIFCMRLQQQKVLK